MTIPELIVKGYQNWDNASVLCEVGSELEDRARFIPARIFLERCIELDPSGQPPAYIHLAYSHFRDAAGGYEMEKGLSAMQHGLAATDSDLIRVILGSWMGGEDEEEAQDLMQTAADRCNDVHPITVAAVRMWRDGMDNAVEALGDVDTTVQQVLDMDDASVQTDLALILLHLGVEGRIELDKTTIDVVLEAAMRSGSEKIDTYKSAVNIYRALDRWEKVGAVCARGLDFIPDEETLMHNLAVANLNLGDTVHAEKWYQRAIGAKPSFAGARIGLAQLYDAQGRKDEAVETAREVVSANPDFVFGHAQAAVILDRNGLTAEGLDILRGIRESLAPWMIRSIQSDEAMRSLWEKLDEPTDS